MINRARTPADAWTEPTRAEIEHDDVGITVADYNRARACIAKCEAFEDLSECEVVSKEAYEQATNLLGAESVRVMRLERQLENSEIVRKANDEEAKRYFASWQSAENDIRVARTKLAEAQSQFADEERLHSQTIDERDKAEECIGAVYNEIVGEWPEWSNLFGYQDAINSVSEHVAARDKELAEARAVFDAIASARNGGIDRLHSWLIKLPMTDAEYDLFTRAIAQRGK